MCKNEKIRQHLALLYLDNSIHLSNRIFALQAAMLTAKQALFLNVARESYADAQIATINDLLSENHDDI